MSLQRFICQYEDIEHKVSCDRELGRVRGVILFDESYDINTLIAKLRLGTSAGNEEARNMMIDAVLEGHAFIISETNGTFDGGNPKMGDGYTDDEVERVLYSDYALEFKDPSFEVNANFWENIEKRRWLVCWRTETLLYFADKPATIVTKAPIEKDLSSDVVWEVAASWRSTQKPSIAPYSAIKEFFEGDWQPLDWVVNEDGYLVTNFVVNSNGYLVTDGEVTNEYLHKQ